MAFACLASAAGAADEADLRDLIFKWQNDEVIAKIQATPALLNVRLEHAQTPLIFAAQECDAKLVRALLALNPELNLADDEGQTALIRACKNGSLDAAKALVEKGADIYLKDMNGLTGEEMARQRNHADIADYLHAYAAAHPPGVGPSPAPANPPATVVNPPAGGPEPTVPDTGETFVEALDHYHSALALALLAAHPEVVRTVNAKGQTGLMMAAKNGLPDPTKAILEKHPDVNQADNDGNTALHTAAMANSQAVIELLLAAGADPTLKNKAGQTALDLAKNADRYSAIAALQTAKAPAPAGPAIEAPPELMAALTAHQTSKLKDILGQKPALVNAVDSRGFPILILSASMGQGDIVTYLLDNGAPVNAMDPEKNTALGRAAKNGHVNLVKLLVERGAALDLADKWNKRPLDYAVEGNHGTIVAYLKARSTAGEEPTGGVAGLIQAIASGNLTQVQALVRASPQIAAQTDGRGRTPLHFAVTGPSEIAAWLLDQQADPNKGDPNQWRPIHIAAEAGRADMVKLLLEHQANPNVAATPGDQTPLYIAAVYGFTAVVKDLLAAQADPNLAAAGGVTALHRAAAAGYLDIVSLLVVAKANLNLKDAKGRTALDYAIVARQTAVIALLVQRGATGNLPVPAVAAEPAPRGGPVVGGAGDAGPVAGYGKPDSRATLDPTQQAEFLAACHQADYAKIDALLKANVNLIFSKDQSGYGALHQIVYRGNAEWCKKLLDLGVPVDVRHKYGRTPLHRACEFGNADCIQVLLDAGADINAVDDEKWTCFHHLTKNAEDEPKFRKSLEIMLARDPKPDVTAKDTSGLTPYGEAKKFGRTLAIEVLEAHGVKE